MLFILHNDDCLFKELQDEHFGMLRANDQNNFNFKYTIIKNLKSKTYYLCGQQ